MNPLILVSDVDGVLTSDQKGFWGQCNLYNGFPQRGMDDIEFAKCKFFSERDNWCLEMLKGKVLLVSQDPWNQLYADHKGLPICIFKGGPGERFTAMRDFAKKHFHFDDFDYVYLGDSMSDWICLSNAVLGFVPSDCSEFLRMKICAQGKTVARLNSNGGHGCLEDALLFMRQKYHEFIQRLGLEGLIP